MSGIDELLKNLRAEYLASIPEKITAIERQIKAGDLANLSDSFHKLKGTGTTYGLPEVSALAALAEEVCNRQSQRAMYASTLALGLLREIYVKKNADRVFHLDQDPRFAELRKLLQNLAAAS